MAQALSNTSPTPGKQPMQKEKGKAKVTPEEEVGATLQKEESMAKSHADREEIRCMQKQMLHLELNLVENERVESVTRG